MYAVTDLETTGIRPGTNEILTIATILADDDFNEVDVFHRGIRPEYKNQWSEDAENIHNITWDKAQSFKDSKQVLDDYVSFLSNYGRDHSFVCHALPFGNKVNTFDRNFVFYWFHYDDRRVDYYRLFPEDKMYTTIAAKRKQACLDWGIENQKLGTWADKLGVKFKHHNALEDARVTLQVLKYQRSDSEWETFKDKRT